MEKENFKIRFQMPDLKKIVQLQKQLKRPDLVCMNLVRKAVIDTQFSKSPTFRFTQ
jgi:hypothetical protein